MTRPGKILSQAGFEPRIFCSQDRHLNHLAIEAVNFKSYGFHLMKYAALIHFTALHVAFLISQGGTCGHGMIDFGP